MVIDVVFSRDSRWVAVSSNHGTTHVFAITPYGGPVTVRTHTRPHVVNRASRYQRSSGLEEYQLTRPIPARLGGGCTTSGITGHGLGVSSASTTSTSTCLSSSLAGAAADESTSHSCLTEAELLTSYGGSRGLNERDPDQGMVRCCASLAGRGGGLLQHWCPNLGMAGSGPGPGLSSNSIPAANLESEPTLYRNI
ncbi:unnamed protein product [Protopolystoma xenopodis]|uniref:BCAS3 WD40 domain-containing protein n=1 Tax=Protopolystoma xenopodis TaxID=117903 RepID=A0A3S5A7Y3_9PLAT|nr:unnamed protein product [Protopolystoma xenopodis]